MDFLSNVRPTYVEINLDNLAHNFREIERIVKKDTVVMPVIKANAYGHGSVELAKLYKDIGAKRFAVSLLNEAIELRKAGIKEPILILNYTPNSQMVNVVEHDLIQSIYRFEDAVVLSEKAKEMGKNVKIHLKIDTGMGRLGFLPEDDSIEDILKIIELKNIEVEGIFTHFAKADEVDKTFTEIQYKRFQWVIEELDKKGVNILIKHVSNSAAIIDIPEYNLDIVRPGIILYGYYPSDEVIKERIDLKPAMTLKAVISNIKIVPKETGISYGHLFTTEKESKIATVPIGYADGYTRILTGKAEAYVGDRIVPIAGKICMDQLMLDITGLDDIKIGDEVVFFGVGNSDYPQVDEVATKLGTVNYEIICMMGRRLPRVYVKGGNVVKTVDYLLD
ncbi:MAG: alanine racemase [Gudongella sp.]|nr:alanine racemase [Gudongella sp.]